MIEHFILTRTCFRDRSDDFIRYRFRMLRQFCAASLMSQTRKDFTWVVHMASEQPYYKEWSRYFGTLPFKVILIDARTHNLHHDDHPGTDSFWLDAIKEELKPHTSYILTTRIDDDDIMKSDFVFRLKETIKIWTQPNVWSFPRGYVLTLNSGGSKYRSTEVLTNNMVSVLSPRKQGVLVCDATHNSIGKLGPIHVVDRKPAWIWTRHPYSCTSGGRKKSKNPMRNLFRDFPILADTFCGKT